MRRGFSLFELSLVVALMGLLALIAAPRVAGWLDAAALREETIQLVGALDAARGTGMRLGNAAVTLADSGYVVRAAVPPDTITTWWRSGPASRGIQLSGSGPPITFGAAGIATGASNRTITLTKGSVTARVVISRLGRLTY